MGLSENRLNPYTQWFCWSLSLLNGYNWGYTPFSDIPIYHMKVYYHECDFVLSFCRLLHISEYIVYIRIPFILVLVVIECHIFGGLSQDVKTTAAFSAFVRDEICAAVFACLVSLHFALDGNSYGHLSVISGYFYGIIYSINGVISTYNW